MIEVPFRASIALNRADLIQLWWKNNSSPNLFLGDKFLEAQHFDNFILQREDACNICRQLAHRRSRLDISKLALAGHWDGGPFLAQRKLAVGNQVKLSGWSVR